MDKSIHQQLLNSNLWSLMQKVPVMQLARSWESIYLGEHISGNNSVLEDLFQAAYGHMQTSKASSSDGQE